jgi:hypothetical protein
MRESRVSGKDRSYEELGAALDGDALEPDVLGDAAGDEGAATDGVVTDDGLDDAGVLQPMTAPPMAPAIASASRIRLIMVGSPPIRGYRPSRQGRPSPLTIQVGAGRRRPKVGAA